MLRYDDMWFYLLFFHGLSLILLLYASPFFPPQPLLGVEGDPMRLLFERDLTPHPQYAAAYAWLKVREGGGLFPMSLYISLF